MNSQIYCVNGCASTHCIHYLLFWTLTSSSVDILSSSSHVLLNFLKALYLFVSGCSGSPLSLGLFSSRSRAHSVALCGLLIKTACLVAAHRLYTEAVAATPRRLCFSTGSVVGVQGLVAPWHAGSSRIRDQIRVSCIGRQILLPPSHQRSPIPCSFDVTLLNFDSFLVSDTRCSRFCLRCGISCLFRGL